MLKRPFMCHLPTCAVSYPPFCKMLAMVISLARTCIGENIGIQLCTPTRVGVRPVIRPVREGEQFGCAE